MGVWCLYRLCGCMVFVDCHATASAVSRNDGERAFMLSLRAGAVATCVAKQGAAAASLKSIDSALAESIFSVAPQGATSSRPLRGAKKRGKGGQ